MIFLGLAAGLSGCGEGGPALVPVSGKMLADGKPLQDAQIAFIPDASNAVLTPGADTTGADGSFKARYNNRPGLAPGKYSVKASKSAPVAGKQLPPELKYDSLQQQMAGITKEALSQNYTKELVVSEKGEEGLEFDFASEPAKKK